MNILCYDDAAAFGGHEIMFIRVAAALRRHHSVSLIIAKKNETLLDEAVRQNMPATHQIRWASGAMQWVLPEILRFITDEPDKLLDELRPDVVVVAQGRVETGLAMLYAAKRRGILTISYIPLAHTVAVGSARPYLASLRDHWLRRHYAAPDGYIAISDGIRDLLRERGVEAPIVVVPNRIDTSQALPSRAEARRALNLPMDAPVIGVVGRVLFSHKGQDLMLKAFEAFRNRHPDAVLCFAGDGPDLPALNAAVSARGYGDSVRLLGWRSDASRLIRAFDCLAIPSKFEGVPLVMLEALYSEVPVVGTAVDGMRDYLPREWLFAPSDADGLNVALDFALRPEAAVSVETLRNRVVDDCNRFDERIQDAVDSLARRALS